MNRTTFVFGIVALFISVSAFATSSDQSVVCAPAFPAKGTVTQVIVNRITGVASLSYGAPSFGKEIKVANYQTVIDGGDSLSSVIYHGQGFSLVVDESQSLANLTADFYGENIQIENLQCTINDFGTRN